MNGNHGRLVEDDPLPLNVHQRIGGSQINRQIVRKPAQNEVEKQFQFLLFIP
jgi:hypothetical protein